MESLLNKLPFCIFISTILISCSGDLDLSNVKHSGWNGLSEKQKYYLFDPNRLDQRVCNRKALFVQVFSSDPRHNHSYYDCSQPGYTCDVGAKSLSGDKASIIGWLDNQVPNVTSQMLEDSILTDTTWNTIFPGIFYTNIKNAIIHDTLRLAYNGVDLSVIDNYTEELIYNHKWEDTWSYNGGGNWKKFYKDPNTGCVVCTDPGLACKTGLQFTDCTNFVGLFDTIFTSVDFYYYVEHDQYECNWDTLGGFTFIVCPTLT